MWERWRKGESLQQIAQLFDRNHSSIQPILAATGGIRPGPAMSLPFGADPGRTRRDLARGGCGSFNAFDGSATRPSLADRILARFSALLPLNRVHHIASRKK